MGRSTLTTSGRPDSKKADLSYINGQGGIISFAIPNALTPTYKHIEEVKRNLVDGYIENGVEIVKTFGNGTNVAYDYNTGLITVYDNNITTDSSGILSLTYYNGISLYTELNIKIEGYYSGYFRFYSSGVISAATTTNAVIADNIKYFIYIKKSPYLATQGTTTFTDLIGDPANYPQSLKNRLASGKGVGFMNSLLAGQDGTDYTDGTNDVPILSKKASNIQSQLYYNASTQTYQVTSFTLNNIDNKYSATIAGGTYPYLSSYQAQNQSAIPITTPKAIEYVDRDLIASNHNEVENYNGLIYASSGKVSTGITIETKPLSNVIVDAVGTVTSNPKYEVTTLDNTSIVGTVAVVGQTENGTQIYTQEKVYDNIVLDFGDTGEIDQLINGTTLDANGNTVQTKVLYKANSVKL